MENRDQSNSKVFNEQKENTGTEMIDIEQPKLLSAKKLDLTDKIEVA